MEREYSWVSHCFGNVSETKNLVFDSFSDLNEEETDKEVFTVPLDSILPGDLLERILTFLPIASIFRAKSVCKRWNEIVTSRRFLRINNSHLQARRPWYFMFTSSDEPIGYSYDPILRKWYNLDLPFIQTSNLFISSSCGLVCFMDKDSRAPDLYICNPITKFCKGVDGTPGPNSPGYTSLAVSVYHDLLSYEVSIIKCKEKFGAEIYFSAVTLVSEMIHKDPTCFNVLYDLGLPASFLSSVVTVLLPSSKAIMCIPNGIGAICLNPKGLEALRDTSALRFLVEIFTDKKYVMAVNEGIVPLANALEELLRHISSLRVNGVDLIIEIINKNAFLAEPECMGSLEKLRGNDVMDMDSVESEDKKGINGFPKRRKVLYGTCV